jgi:hypothetical protein
MPIALFMILRLLADRQQYAIIIDFEQFILCTGQLF